LILCPHLPASARICPHLPASARICPHLIDAKAPLPKKSVKSGLHNPTINGFFFLEAINEMD
jgi:hypothetical protein